MSDPDPGEITRLLDDWSGGDRQALERLIPLVYSSLRQIAANCMRGERPEHTLQPTALVHELYFRLLELRQLNFEDRAHFFSFAARLMRRILIDHARSSKAEKRGGSQAVFVPLSEEFHWIAWNDDARDLDRALDKLSQLDPRKVRLIELRLFLGFSAEEAAEILGISKATADRDFKMSRSWLYRELRGEGGGRASAG